MPSDLRLTAEALDLTPWYDLFASSEATTKNSAPANRPVSAPAEPDPVPLPVTQGTFDVRVGRFYLREIEASNLVATARVQGSRILLDPLQLNVNAAPVSARADLDLGVKGWRYDLAAKAEAVPLEPLANSFSPATRGQYQGLLLGDFALRGAGITGPSLQRNLTGRLGFTFTNANLQLTGPNKARGWCRGW